jgi:hypothetical protein
MVWELLTVPTVGDKFANGGEIPGGQLFPNPFPNPRSLDMFVNPAQAVPESFGP